MPVTYFSCCTYTCSVSNTIYSSALSLAVSGHLCCTVRAHLSWGPGVGSQAQLVTNPYQADSTVICYTSERAYHSKTGSQKLGPSSAEMQPNAHRSLFVNTKRCGHYTAVTGKFSYVSYQQRS